MIKIHKHTDAYTFVVQSKAGRALLESVSFTNKKALKNTLAMLYEVSPTAQKIERRTNFDGQFLFDLKDMEGKTIGHSGLYSSEAGMENGIKNFQACLEGLNELPEL